VRFQRRRWCRNLHGSFATNAIQHDDALSGKRRFYFLAGLFGLYPEFGLNIASSRG
jgi:hypothetical protein